MCVCVYTTRSLWHLQPVNGFLVVFLPSTFRSSCSKPIFLLSFIVCHAAVKWFPPSRAAPVTLGFRLGDSFPYPLHLTLSTPPVLSRCPYSCRSTVLITVRGRLVSRADIPLDGRVPHCSSFLLFCLPPRLIPGQNLQLSAIVSLVLGSGQHFFPFIYLYTPHIYIYLFLATYYCVFPLVEMFAWLAGLADLAAWLKKSKAHTLGVGQKRLTGWAGVVGNNKPRAAHTKRLQLPPYIRSARIYLKKGKHNRKSWKTYSNKLLEAAEGEALWPCKGKLKIIFHFYFFTFSLAMGQLVPNRKMFWGPPTES